MKVSISSAAGVQETTAGADGAFTFTGLAAGMYVIRVFSTNEDLVIAPREYPVTHDETDARVGVIVVGGADGEAQVALMWVPTSSAVTIDLEATFFFEDGQTQCGVGQGRPICAEMDHSNIDGEPAASVRIAPSAASDSRSYLFAANAKMETCSGYGRPSSSELAGGTDDADGVDCYGNCKTGRSYCYSGANGRCASCVLWEPADGEVSCYAYGPPQGGPVPGTRATTIPRWAVPSRQRRVWPRAAPPSRASASPRRWSRCRSFGARRTRLRAVG